MASPLAIVFHGQNAANFRRGFEQMIDGVHTLVDVSDALSAPGEAEHFASADVIIGIKLDASMPAPRQLRL
jgi:hypothetical protein